MTEEESSTPRKKRANGTGTMFYDKKRKFWLVRYCYAASNGAQKKKTKIFQKREEAEVYLEGISRRRHRRLAALNANPQHRDRLTAGEKMVYFIQPFGGGPVKIGVSGNISKRLAVLQNHNPYPLNLLCICPGGYQVEIELHRRFERYRLHGEWFEGSEELMSFIEGLKRETSAF